MESISLFSDSELLANLRSEKKSGEAIRMIYKDHFDLLSRHVMNNNGSLQDAEDVFQEVVISFIKIVEQGKFRGESTIKTFLFSLNRHIWLNELKRRNRANFREEKFEKGKDAMENDISIFIADRESRGQVIRLVSELGENCRKILLAYYYENLSMKEILEQMNYENEQVVRNKKYKCLKQLEQMITAQPYLKQTLKNLLHE